MFYGLDLFFGGGIFTMQSKTVIYRIQSFYEIITLEFLAPDPEQGRLPVALKTTLLARKAVP